MNRYIASSGGGQIAMIHDDPEYPALVKDTLAFWLQRGLMIHMESITPAAKPVKPAAPVKRPYHRKQAAVVKPSHKAKPAEPDKYSVIKGNWKKGDKVYLNWLELPDANRVHLSQYRNAVGIVEEFRGGRGVRNTVGVRFNDDPELVWLAPKMCSNSPEVI